MDPDGNAKSAPLPMVLRQNSKIVANVPKGIVKKDLFVHHITARFLKFANLLTIVFRRMQFRTSTASTFDTQVLTYSGWKSCNDSTHTT
jgi:hypothetical protein